MQVKYSDEQLKSMSPAGRASGLEKLARATQDRPNGELVAVREQVAAFEHRFGIDSEVMRQEVTAGKRPETWDICQWLMLLNRRSRLEKLASRSE